MERSRVSTGTDWESKVGYSRAIRAGNQVHVSGTTATDEAGNVVGEDDPYEQTRQALDNVEDALEALDATLTDVVRTRIYVRDADDWAAVGRAHGEYFGEIRPATTLVEVSRLVEPTMLVELEATAVLEDRHSSRTRIVPTMPWRSWGIQK